MSERKKHRVIIGIEISLLCMILATLSINAASSNPPSNGVSYNKNNQTTVQNALDDLYNKASYGNATAGQILKGKTALVGGKKVTGAMPNRGAITETINPEGTYTIPAGYHNGSGKVTCEVPILLANLFELGDYVRYVSNNTSYILSMEDTGYISNQTINPSELNLWRVIKKNEDGTVDLISEYVSSDMVYFDGYIGYRNYEDMLDTIAKKYERVIYTIGSRIGKEGDMWLLKKIIGTLEAKKIGTLSYADYWLDAKTTSTNLGTCNSGDLYDSSVSGMVCRTKGDMAVGVIIDDEMHDYHGSGVRPIVVLKSNLKITGGDGTKDSPYTIGV